MTEPTARPNTLALLKDSAQLITTHGADAPEVESFITSHANNRDFSLIARLGQALWRGLRNPLPPAKKHKKRKKHRQ